MIEVHITHAMRFRSVAFYILRKNEPFGASGKTELATSLNDDQSYDGINWVEIERGTVPTPGPSLIVDEELARAMLDALSAYYGGSSDMQTLRKDYMAERKRVDNLIDHLAKRGPLRQGD